MLPYSSFASPAAALLIGYLLGSIPFGLIFTRLAGAPDIRSIGSGNIGATNVLRTGHTALAVATLLCDMLKGTAAVLIVLHFYNHSHALVAAAGAFVGHLFPIWLKFKGGKGVAIYIGLLLALAWPVTVAFAAIWAVAAWLTRYSSLAALIASAATPGILWGLGFGREALLFLLLTVLIFIMHRGNIARLMSGTEGRIGQSASTP